MNYKITYKIDLEPTGTIHVKNCKSEAEAVQKLTKYIARKTTVKIIGSDGVSDEPKKNEADTIMDFLKGFGNKSH